MYSDEEPTPNRVLADGWRLTRATFALEFLEIPDTIEFQVDGGNHILATRLATLDELAKAVVALDKAIERRGEGKVTDTDLHGRFKMEEQRDGLAELQKRASQGGAPPSTTVIEALFPDVPVKKKTPPPRSTGGTSKSSTPMACWTNGSCLRSSIWWAASTSPALLEATFGFGSAIFPNKLSKGCGKEENQHSSSTTGRFDDE
jgi:hypothetical protein